jgi:hypothetical protein
MIAIREHGSVIGMIAAWVGLVAAAYLAPLVLPYDDAADLVTRQTARVAVAFWGLACAALILRIHDPARWLWSLACGAFVIHVGTAFDRVHHWSHAAAYDHVADVSGFGPGIFVSYFFALLWIADATWWWVDSASYDSRPQWLRYTLHGFMASIMFSGTVVYETGFIRWASAAVFIALGALILRQIRCPRGALSVEAAP